MCKFWHNEPEREMIGCSLIYNAILTPKERDEMCKCDGTDESQNCYVDEDQKMINKLMSQSW